LTLKLKKIKEPKRPKRRPLTPAEFERFLAAIPTALQKNAVGFGDYVRFLSHSGGREQESLNVRWKEDVDLK